MLIIKLHLVSLIEKSVISFASWHQIFSFNGGVQVTIIRELSPLILVEVIMSDFLFRRRTVVVCID